MSSEPCAKQQQQALIGRCDLKRRKPQAAPRMLTAPWLLPPGEARNQQTRSPRCRCQVVTQAPGNAAEEVAGVVPASTAALSLVQRGGQLGCRCRWHRRQRQLCCCWHQQAEWPRPVHPRPWDLYQPCRRVGCETAGRQGKPQEQTQAAALVVEQESI